MKILLSAPCLVLLAACASSPKSRAVQTVVLGDVVADEVGARWTDFVDGRIAKCREKALVTPRDRRECLGVAAEGETLAATLDSLVLVQRAVATALRCEELKACAQDPDWHKLARDALSVFREIERLSKASK